MGPDVQNLTGGKYVFKIDSKGLTVTADPPGQDRLTCWTELTEPKPEPEPGWKEKIPENMKARRVVHHYPATVVIWEDGTKTVVKCDPGDEYDPKYGLALCYMKKALGNTSRALNDAIRNGMEGVEE